MTRATIGVDFKSGRDIRFDVVTAPAPKDIPWEGVGIFVCPEGGVRLIDFREVAHIYLGPTRVV